MSDLFTDADVERAAAAIYESVGPFKWDPDVKNAHPTIAEMYRDHARFMLTATLPAIRARWLNKLADEVEHDGWGHVGAAWLRAKAGEER